MELLVIIGILNRLIFIPILLLYGFIGTIIGVRGYAGTDYGSFWAIGHGDPWTQGSIWVSDGSLVYGKTRVYDRTCDDKKVMFGLIRLMD